MHYYKESLYRFNLFCLYIFLLYQTLTRMVILVDGRGRILSLVIIICIIYNWKNNKQWKKILLSKPIIIWGIWCVFTSINIAVQGHKLYTDIEGEVVIFKDDMFYLHIIFQQLIAMTTTCWLYLQNKKCLIKHIVIIFVLTAVITLLFDSDKVWGGEVRFGSVMGNNAALMMVSFVFVLLIAWVNKYVNKCYIIGGITLAVILVFAIQTRKALLAIAIIFTFAYLARVNNRNPFTWILLPVGFFVISYATDYILNSTSIGNRILMIGEQGETSNLTGISFLNLLGDRAMHVYLGWEIWLKYPLFGVGLQNAPYYSHLPYIFHQEYIGQLAENGIIGFSLFIMFYSIIIKDALRRLSVNKKNYVSYCICLGYIVALLFISFTAWTYQFSHYFVALGIIIGETRIARNV